MQIGKEDFFNSSLLSPIHILQEALRQCNNQVNPNSNSTYSIKKNAVKRRVNTGKDTHEEGRQE